MRLLNEVKMLRAAFPDIKIRQLLDDYNMKYALFVTPDPDEEIRVLFDHYEYILQYYGYEYKYNKKMTSFDNVVEEIRYIMSGKSILLKFYGDGKLINSAVENSNMTCKNNMPDFVNAICLYLDIRDPGDVTVTAHIYGQKPDKSLHLGKVEICEYIDDFSFRNIKIKEFDW
ncbi:MAG: hypothetical protein LUG91_10235 [Ruminococcus sp.]|nr:hypothetical protein [Ruminococcus sp.]